MEYHLICQQNLVRALNDAGPRGVITRALFDVQKLSVDLLSAEHLQAVQRQCLRIRQLLAMKRCDLRLLHASSEEDNMQDMSALATSLAAVLPEHTHADSRVVQDINMLHSIGIDNVEDMLTIGKSHVLPASSLVHTAADRTSSLNTGQLGTGSPVC